MNRREMRKINRDLTSHIITVTRDVCTMKNKKTTRITLVADVASALIAKSLATQRISAGRNTPSSRSKPRFPRKLVQSSL